MPAYSFRNIETDEVTEHFFTISEMEDFVSKNPNMVREYVKAPGVITGFHQKPENGFRDLLKDIKKSNSRGISQSSINTF
jgi:hypothetical protein